MKPSSYIRRKLSWCVHCSKALLRSYHYQLLPLFDLIIEADDMVVDVGAHAGQFSKIFARRASRGLVLALEPASYPYSILRVVGCLHRLRSLKIIKVGISAKAGELVIETPLKKSGVLRYGLSRIRSGDEAINSEAVISENIPTTTIDILCRQFGKDRRFSLLKADIEGYEYAMLCGASEAIAADKPCLLLEISVNREEIMNFLWQRDYLVFALLNYSGKSREPLRLAEIKEVHENQTRNILAVNAANSALLATIRNNHCA